MKRHGNKSLRAFVVWITGLSGSVKSTIADYVYRYLKQGGYRIEKLDGDVVRSILPNTGFSRDERNEHIRRVGFLASMLERNGISVIASFISPYKQSRDFVRKNCEKFIEVYMSTPLDVCEKRDVKGLYSRARRGEVKNFTGLDDPYEKPANPEITIDTSNISIEEAAEEVIQYLKSINLIKG